MTATDASAALAAIRAREQAATPGPWVVETPESVYGHDGGEDWRDLRWVSDAATVGDDDPPWLGPMPTADAEFIAHARTDVPRMAAALAAVLALHTPTTEAVPHYRLAGVCPTCVDERGNPYDEHPCPTVAAITDALDRHASEEGS